MTTTPTLVLNPDHPFGEGSWDDEIRTTLGLTQAEDSSIKDVWHVVYDLIYQQAEGEGFCVQLDYHAPALQDSEELRLRDELVAALGGQGLIEPALNCYYEAVLADEEPEEFLNEHAATPSEGQEKRVVVSHELTPASLATISCQDVADSWWCIHGDESAEHGHGDPDLEMEDAIDAIGRRHQLIISSERVFRLDGMWNVLWYSSERHLDPSDGRLSDPEERSWTSQHRTLRAAVAEMVKMPEELCRSWDPESICS